MVKRILVIGLTDRVGGVETFIYNTTINSDKSKYQYYFLVHGSKKCVFEKEINNFYNDEKHIFFIDSIKKRPLKVFKQLFNFYKNNKFDYIHLQTGSTAEIMYVFPFILFMKTKLISHSHNGNGTNVLINNIFKPLVRFCSSKYLACSDVAAKWLFGNLPKNKYTIINNGIDTNRFKYKKEYRINIRKEYNIPDKMKIIGHIGRFSVQKNHKKILRILCEILKIDQNYILMLIGTGELEEQVKQECQNLNLVKNVIFAGVHMNTECFYSAFDYFLMPSLYEGLPIVGIEAQSCGVMCFFSNTIDKQILITSCSNMIELNKSDKYWAKKIIQHTEIEDREKPNKEIFEKGYSLFSTIDTLSKIYLGDNNE